MISSTNLQPWSNPKADAGENLILSLHHRPPRTTLPKLTTSKNPMYLSSCRPLLSAHALKIEGIKQRATRKCSILRQLGQQKIPNLTVCSNQIRQKIKNPKKDMTIWELVLFTLVIIAHQWARSSNYLILTKKPWLACKKSIK